MTVTWSTQQGTFHVTRQQHDPLRLVRRSVRSQSPDNSAAELMMWCCRYDRLFRDIQNRSLISLVLVSTVNTTAPMMMECVRLQRVVEETLRAYAMMHVRYPHPVIVSRNSGFNSVFRRWVKINFSSRSTADRIRGFQFTLSVTFRIAIKCNIFFNSVRMKMKTIVMTDMNTWSCFIAFSVAWQSQSASVERALSKLKNNLKKQTPLSLRDDMQHLLLLRKIDFTIFKMQTL